MRAAHGRPILEANGALAQHGTARNAPTCGVHHARSASLSRLKRAELALADGEAETDTLALGATEALALRDGEAAGVALALTISATLTVGGCAPARAYAAG